MNNSQILKDLFRSRNPHQILLNIKTLDYNSASKKIDQAISHQITKSFLFDKKSLPNNIQELFQAKTLSHTGNLEGEIAWYVRSLLKYSGQINEFIKLEEQFQKKILFDNYEEATVILKKIDTEICYSFWSIENMFSIEQVKNGTESNWQLLKKTNDGIISPYVLFFNHFFSKKAEKDITILQYKRDLENSLNNTNSSIVESTFFKLGNFYPDNYSDFSSIIHSESKSSIIDKYILLIDLISEISTHDEYKNLSELVIKDLVKHGFKDKRIIRLAECNNLIEQFEDFNIDILDLFELYSYGDYKECIAESIILLKKYPESIEIYETYIKCLLELDLEFSKTNVSMIIDDVLSNLYSLYKKNNDFYESKENLLKLYLSFPKLPFFKQILSLTLTLTNSDYRKAIAQNYFIFSKYSNPQNILFSKLKNTLSFNKELIENYSSIRINYSLAKNNYELIKNDKFPQHKKDIYKARIGFYHSDQIDFELLTKLSQNKKITLYLREEILIYSFKAYLNTNQIDQIISLITDSFFENKFLIERINIGVLVNYIIGKNYELSEINIDLPLFFYIHKVDSYFLYASLEQFLNTLMVDRPSMLSIEGNNTKLIFLLSKVCSLDVLNNFYLVYESDDEVVEERIKILRILTTLDKLNSDHYLEEIATLTQRQKITKTIKTVNDGKISLNFSRIKEDKEYNLENSFNRFIKFKDFSDKNEINSMDLSDLLNLFFSDLNSDESKLQDASFVSFKSLFFEVVDHFLFSKEHGLDGDLSTRIRHGVLENQLRPIFTNSNLIANIGSDNKYNDVQYWIYLCNEKIASDDISQKIQNALKDFSKAIDNLISKIVKEDIQIQSNRHSSKNLGLFNYRFTEEYLWLLYKQISSTTLNYDDFLNSIFELLKIHTEENLKQIAIILKTEINLSFQNIIDKLQDKLKQILLNKTDVWIEINQNINHVKTQIETELYEVSKWFKLNNNSNNSILDIDTIVYTAIESININNIVKIKPDLNIVVDRFFERGFFYIDIFKILIENTIKHSNLDIENLKISISVKNEILPQILKNIDNPLSKIVLEISNNLSRDVNIEEIERKLSVIVYNWNSDLSLVDKEGGSGFQKIERILNYDIKVYDSLMSFEITDFILTIKLEFYTL